MFNAQDTVFLYDLMNSEQVRPLIDKAMSTYELYEQKSKEELMPVYIPTREELNKKILNYYKYRQIGFGTIGRFLDELEIALVEIMPYYNYQFFVLDQDYDVLHNVDYIKEIDIERKGQGTSEGTSENTASDSSTGTTIDNDYGKSVTSETPQGDILGINAKGIDTVDHASNIGWSHNNSEGTSTTEGTSSSTGSVSNTSSSEDTEKMKEITKGNYGQVSYQSLLRQYRELIRNIEQEIINNERIAELFLQIY